MKPIVHAFNSVKRYGGTPEDYFPLHDFMDSTKSGWADIRHRAILHNTFGVYIAEKVFGPYIKNSDGEIISTRQIAEDHVVEDCGFIPTLEDWFKDLPTTDWMLGKGQKNFVKKTFMSQQHHF